MTTQQGWFTAVGNLISANLFYFLYFFVVKMIYKKKYMKKKKQTGWKKKKNLNRIQVITSDWRKSVRLTCQSQLNCRCPCCCAGGSKSSTMQIECAEISKFAQRNGYVLGENKNPTHTQKKKMKKKNFSGSSFFFFLISTPSAVFFLLLLRSSFMREIDVLFYYHFDFCCTLSCTLSTHNDIHKARESEMSKETKLITQKDQWPHTISITAELWYKKKFQK